MRVRSAFCSSCIIKPADAASSSRCTLCSVNSTRFSVRASSGLRTSPEPLTCVLCRTLVPIGAPPHTPLESSSLSTPAVSLLDADGAALWRLLGCVHVTESPLVWPPRRSFARAVNMPRRTASQVMERTRLVMLRVLVLLHALEAGELASVLPGIDVLVQSHGVDTEDAMVAYRPLLRLALEQWPAREGEGEEGQAAEEKASAAAAEDGQVPAASDVPVDRPRPSGEQRPLVHHRCRPSLPDALRTCVLQERSVARQLLAPTASRRSGRSRPRS